MSFDAFVKTARPSLTRALVGHIDRRHVDDVLSEAFAYAWENWDDLADYESPMGYLFRICQSKARQPKVPALPLPEPGRIPDFEPQLVPALLRLPDSQRSAVWLIEACRWSYRDTAEALDMSVSAVGTHRQRGMAKLRKELGA